MKSVAILLSLAILASVSADSKFGLRAAPADNTPNLCTKDIPGLTRIKPSVTASHTIPDITVGSRTYIGDEDHFVVRPLWKDSGYQKALVFIPGTTYRPEQSSCFIKSALNSIGGSYPILALSYQYLNSGDSDRNRKCALLAPAEQVVCLEEQHKDAINGGDYGANHVNKKDGSAFWGEVLPKNSLTQRLVDLLVYLHAKHPYEGWDGFLEGDLPRWDKLVVIGHDQGAGHAAYLSKTEQLDGAVMFSGPQDRCVGCADGTKFWIDGLVSYLKITAIGHGEEKMYSVMAENWVRMKTAGGGSWTSAEPHNVGFALNTTTSDAVHSPLRTDVQYAATSTCGRKYHSTAIDDSVPFTEIGGEKLYLYELSVWPSLLGYYNGEEDVTVTMEGKSISGGVDVV